jgi:hypothetical protein
MRCDGYPADQTYDTDDVTPPGIVAETSTPLLQMNCKIRTEPERMGKVPRRVFRPSSLSRLTHNNVIIII